MFEYALTNAKSHFSYRENQLLDELIKKDTKKVMDTATRITNLGRSLVDIIGRVPVGCGLNLADLLRPVTDRMNSIIALLESTQRVDWMSKEEKQKIQDSKAYLERLVKLCWETHWRQQDADRQLVIDYHLGR